MIRARPYRSKFPDPIDRFSQGRDGTIEVVQLVEAEQAEAEGLEIGAFAALQRNAGRDLQTELSEFFPGTDGVVRGVAHDYAGRAETIGGDRLDAAFGQDRAYSAAEFELALACLSESEGFGFAHSFSQRTQGVGW